MINVSLKKLRSGEGFHSLLMVIIGVVVATIIFKMYNGLGDALGQLFGAK